MGRPWSWWPSAFTDIPLLACPEENRTRLGIADVKATGTRASLLHSEFPPAEEPSACAAD